MLHFSTDEFSARLQRLLTEMGARKLDAMLLFAQESMYWLTGYDTFGFCFFQSLLVRADGRMALLTRSADLRQAQHTSILGDIRVWTDRKDATPAEQLLAVARDLGVSTGRIGVEFDSYGLTHANGRKLEAAFAGDYELTDASEIITRLRAVKSAAEIVYVREAARLSDAADAAGIAAVHAGADEGDILAAQHNAIFSAGGDYPANEFIIGSGRDALLCRYKAGRRKLDARDQITLEFAGVYRHYHAALMRTITVGDVSPRHSELYIAAHEALLACEAEIRPGRTAGDVFAAHAHVMDAHGLENHRLAACGYSLGAKFTPSWMDWPMFYEGNDWVLEPGMVMFAHMILMDSQSGTAMCLGRTSLTTLTGSEVLNGHDAGLVMK
ncbi:Xaa-Pro dipeptidase [Labrys miyagiensis]|uniref:Xaa-Pro dipeptidase n=1 Tax=Labrys miyagiensis TaxID=346912 RepID=A0ABQ6CK40_9HYPH|nr:Xaa-Pro peptidase family protein [Labrys miyagiensis]GLS20540.1 Xaa-Pro dipeptidase [Labrys miyagiensis]